MALRNIHGRFQAKVAGKAHGYCVLRLGFHAPVMRKGLSLSFKQVRHALRSSRPLNAATPSLQLVNQLLALPILNDPAFTKKLLQMAGDVEQ
jgi:hypothetical protein